MPSIFPKEHVRRLPLTLCKQSQNTATSYSKVPQGLCFPLGVPGLCTRQNFQKLLSRDSRYLVTPFMQVTIQMTRHFAHICYFHSHMRITNHNYRIMAFTYFYVIPYVAIRIGLYLLNFLERSLIKKLLTS